MPAPTLPLLILLAFLFCACSGGPEEPTGPVQVYDVRGVVARLPEGPGTELMITHEEIADFVNAAGDTVGMKAMTMGFPVAEGIELQAFAPGDSVQIRFEVRWGQPAPLRLTEMRKR